MPRSPRGAFPAAGSILASGTTDLYGSSFGAPSPTIAPKDGQVSTTISIPVTLPNVATYLRYVVTVSEGDTRTSENLIGWSQGSAESVDPICPPDNPVNGDCAFDCYNFSVNHPEASSGFSYSTALNPFQLVVEPVAIAQMKVLPYTLLYAPPGNASKASYQMSTSYGVSLTYDNKVANDNSNTVDNKNAVTLSVAQMLSGTVASLFGNVGVGGVVSSNASQMSGFDTSTKTGVGTIQDVATSQSSTLQDSMQFQVSVSNTTPGANGTRATEPVGGDTFVLLKHPQVGLWQLGGHPVVSLLAARGTPSNPDWFEPTVGQLQDCANNGPLNPNGLPIPDTNDVLTSGECAELLTLDPLVTVGESFPGVSTNPRFLSAGGVRLRHCSRWRRGFRSELYADFYPHEHQHLDRSGRVVVHRHDYGCADNELYLRYERRPLWHHCIG